DFNPGVLLVALLLIVGFTAIFWQRHRWDQFEQRYRELLVKRDRQAGAPAGGNGSVVGPDGGRPGGEAVWEETDETRQAPSETRSGDEK
ncbi:MAG TPA: hypothetical protein VGS79_01540, partial [Puia sp.]|nr:hypothetical protein [Puia sp.]